MTASVDAVASGDSVLESLPLPSDGLIRVAVLIDQDATVIDFAGPWEAFQDAVVGGDTGFVLYTVAESRGPVKTSGFAPAIDADGRSTYRQPIIRP